MYPLVAYQYWLTNNSYMDFLLKDVRIESAVLISRIGDRG